MAYLTKKEMLAEIHKCKLTFCSFMEPEDAAYDSIVQSMEEITPDLIEKVRADKSAKLTKKGGKPVGVPEVGLVFRVMTHDHVPLDPDRKRRSRVSNPEHAQTNFPPFKHFKITDDGMVEVLRSHWIGGFENGHFSVEHGRISNKLGRMFIKLVDNYSRIGAFRAYTYLDEMCGNALLHLSQIALRFDESKSDNPFGFFSVSVRHCFIRVISLEKRVQEIRDDLLIAAGAAPSITRQIENELSHRPEYQNGKKPLAGKRGRKTAVERAAMEDARKEEEEMKKD